MEFDLTASNLETEIWITSCFSEKLLLARMGIELAYSKPFIPLHSVAFHEGHFHMEFDLTASNLETEIWITSCFSEKLLLARMGIELAYSKPFIPLHSVAFHEGHYPNIKANRD